MAFYFNQGDRPLPGYTIQRGIGTGGFGEVYYATSDGGKEVALKYLRDNPQVELRGATHCLNLKSPYLVALHDIKQSPDGAFFVIMEYVNGPTLRDLMSSEPAGLGPQKAAYFLREIGKGLAYLHDRGIVHRDLKPGNIFYEDGYVKIGDYGLSKIMAASQHSGQTMSVGTVHYMAPEVGSGNYDRTIDVYALGVVLYEMLLGRVPFSGASMGEVLMKHLTAQPEVDELPEPFPRVIRKALAKDPNDRYQTVTEMMAEVFAVEQINQSIASMDSLSLTRMAAAAAAKVKVGAGGGGRHGAGSSNIPTLAARPVVARAYAGDDEWRGGRMGAPPPPPIPGAHQSDNSRHGAARRRGAFSESTWFPQRHRITTGLLGVLLGPLGVHRFYTGYTAVGVWQIILTVFSGGIAGIWGFVEGVRILSGCDYRDRLGRSLLNERPDSDLAREVGDAVAELAGNARGAAGQRGMEDAANHDLAQRSTVARFVWVVTGALFMFGSIAMLLGATFAPPEYEQVGWTAEGQQYYFNMFHIMYFFGSLTMGFAVFAIWKASHRGGLSTYRATLRPALMCFCVSAIGVSLAMSRFLFAGQAQIGALIVMAFAALGFLHVWLLRGPELVRRPGDLYWNRAFGRIFLLIAIPAGTGAVVSLSAWDDQGAEFYLSKAQTFESVTANERYWNRTSGVFEERARSYSVPGVKFNILPVGGGLLAVLAIGSLVESRYRRRLARLAGRPNDKAAA